MGALVVTSRHGIPIHSVDEWALAAKPAKAEHWQDGRSAKELAKAWINGSGPAALIALLDHDPATADLCIQGAVAEAQTSFDAWPGGRRNHDLLVTGEARGGKTTIGIEGKADEPFGQTIESYYAAANRLIERKSPTNALLRLDELTTGLAGTTLALAPELGRLRYQLFSATAGTMAAAANCSSQAVFVVHEFITDLTDARLQARNEAALCSFVGRVFNAEPPASRSTWLLGPFRIQAERWAHLPLWIGKISTRTRSS